MYTMTLKEAWEIKLIVQASLLKDGFRSVVELQGRSLVEVKTAFKILVSKEYHDLFGTAILLRKANISAKHELESGFKKSLSVYGSGFAILCTTLISHLEWQELERHAEYSLKWALALGKGITSFNNSRDFEEMLAEESELPPISWTTSGLT